MADKKIKSPVVGQIEETYKILKKMGKTTPKMRKAYESFKNEQVKRKVKRIKESKRSSSESLINCMKNAKTNTEKKRCKTTFALKMKK
jgi:hypothetical protein